MSLVLQAIQPLARFTEDDQGIAPNLQCSRVSPLGVKGSV